MTKPRIEPRILKGFRDSLPSLAIARTKMISQLEQVFSSFGFVPIDTPALEYTEVLLGKGSDETDKQLYRFLDNGERDVSLRFDLTVPLARFVAMHANELGMPFKRYHIAPVWRAEKPQRGRYREFIQCDFDIIGTTSTLADAEIVAVIHSALNKLQIAHQVRINNRLILNGLLAEVGAKEKSTAVLRAVDKLEKLGRDVVHEELTQQAQLSPSQIERIFSFLALSTEKHSNAKLLEKLGALFQNNTLANQGIRELAEILATLPSLEIEERFVAIDLSIARGLDYYTGTVFETTFNDLPQIGSICSGGRYDDLASLYTSARLPGVGASIGLDRILGALEELGRLSPAATTARVLVTTLDVSSQGTSLLLGTALRKAGIATEVYPEVGKLGSQLKFADKRGIELAVINGERETKAGVCSVKNLHSGEQQDNIAQANIVSTVEQMLRRGK